MATRLAVTLGAVGIAATILAAERTPAQQVPLLRLTRDLGIDAAEHDLSRVGWLAVSPGGTIAVSQSQDGHIRFFDANGRSLGAFGRKGQGPGEFQTPLRFGWIADTLVVGDFGTRRFTLISPERSLVRTVPWLTSVSIPPDARGVQPRVISLSPRALYAGGSWLLEASMGEGSPPFPGVAKDQPGGPILRVDNEATLQRVIGWRHPSPCVTSLRRSEGGFFALALPLCVTPPLEYAADSRRVAIATFDTPAGRTGSYQVSVVSDTGDTLFARRYDYPVVPIPSRLLDSVRTAQAALRAAPDIVALRRSMKLPETWPPIERLVLGRDETVWIEQYTRAGNRVWQVLNARGDVEGQAAVPRGVRLMAVSREAVWGTDTDEDGLQHIVRYVVSR